MIEVFTIGFSGKKEAEFYSLLETAGVKKLVDIRLWRAPRFVPWASGGNLAEAIGERYIYIPELAPTKELLTGYKECVISWAGYERVFNELLATRQVETLFDSGTLNGACFLCAEKSPDMCHRRLVAEYLAEKFPDAQITHL